MPTRLLFKRPRPPPQDGAAAVGAPGDCLGFAIAKTTQRLDLVEGLLIGACHRGRCQVRPAEFVVCYVIAVPSIFGYAVFLIVGPSSSTHSPQSQVSSGLHSHVR